jgi:eukaryotic-like serine/threonine-protein kinase
MTPIPATLIAALEDRYRIEGGSGHAPTRHQRKVVIKVLRPELAAALGPERFLREITITAQLDHPHILPLLDSGTFTRVAAELSSVATRITSCRSSKENPSAG